jgi:hypothetical protein
MKKLLTLLSLALGAAAFSGCETTGDPNSGGIFWSETKAKQRIAARQAHLNDVESDTAAQRRRNRRLERQLQ